jgi:hypothetical protein
VILLVESLHHENPIVSLAENLNGMHYPMGRPC